MNYFQKQRSHLWGLVRTETCMMGDELYHQYEFGSDECGFSVYRKQDLETFETATLLTISFSDKTWAFQLWPL